MRNIPYTNFLQNKKNIVFEHRADYQIMEKGIVVPDRSQSKISGKHIACWIPEAKTTQSNYVTVITFYQNNGCTNALLLLTAIPVLVQS